MGVAVAQAEAAAEVIKRMMLISGSPQLVDFASQTHRPGSTTLQLFEAAARQDPGKFCDLLGNVQYESLGINPFIEQAHPGRQARELKELERAEKTLAAWKPGLFNREVVESRLATTTKPAFQPSRPRPPPQSRPESRDPVDQASHLLMQVAKWVDPRLQFPSKDTRVSQLNGTLQGPQGEQLKKALKAAIDPNGTLKKSDPHLYDKFKAAWATHNEFTAANRAAEYVLKEVTKANPNLQIPTGKDAITRLSKAMKTPAGMKVFERALGLTVKSYNTLDTAGRQAAVSALKDASKTYNDYVDRKNLQLGSATREKTPTKPTGSLSD